MRPRTARISSPLLPPCRFRSLKRTLYYASPISFDLICCAVAAGRRFSALRLSLALPSTKSWIARGRNTQVRAFAAEIGANNNNKIFGFQSSSAMAWTSSSYTVRVVHLHLMSPRRLLTGTLGVSTEGIFRLSGTQNRITEMKEKLNQGSFLLRHFESTSRMAL